VGGVDDVVVARVAEDAVLPAGDLEGECGQWAAYLRSKLEPLQLSRLAERLRQSTAHGRTHISYTFDSQTSYISTTS
jgi:hypothetical protein